MSAQAVTGTATSVSDAAWKAIEGGYDLQVHVAPDVIERRIDDIDLAHEFLKRKLKGFVLKSHYFPTAERAKVVTKGRAWHTGVRRHHAESQRRRIESRGCRIGRPIGRENRVDAHRGCRQ